MAAGSGFRRVALALIASILALGIPMLAGQAARADGSDRPTQSVALARVAVVRVLTYYYGTTSANPAPIPVLELLPRPPLNAERREARAGPANQQASTASDRMPGPVP